jgi:hypothetical protein
MLANSLQVVSHVDRDVGGRGVQKKRKRATILITEAGVATAICWWDQLTVSEDSVILTAVPGVAPPVVLNVADAPSKEEAQRVSKSISRDVEYSARRIDVRRYLAPHLTEDLG